MRSLVAGFFVTSLLGVLSGCGTEPPAVRATPSPSASPTPGPAIDELRGAFDKMVRTTFRWKVVDGSHYWQVGEVDLPNGRSTMKAVSNDGVVFETVVIGPTYYVWYGKPTAKLLNVPAQRWLRVDSTRAPRFVEMAEQYDFATYASALSTVDRDGFYKFKGTIDLTKTSTQPHVLEHFADGGKSVQFAAGTDTNGYPNTLTFTAPATSKQPKKDVKYTFTDKGPKFDIRPPDQAVDAPAVLYDFFRG